MNKFEFLLVFDVQDGNPNGDPAADNQPRVDYETGQGLVSDVCLKRKVRNFIQVVKGGGDGIVPEEGYDIWVKQGAPLNDAIDSAVEKALAECKKDLPLKTFQSPKKDEEKKKVIEKRREVQRILCDRFVDIRCFGGVLSTGKNNIPVVTGPFQFTFARSVDPITTTDVTVTRCVATTREEDENNEDGKKDKERTMGSKVNVNYGLYVMKGYFNPFWAKKTGVTEADKELILQALSGGMFEFDRSSGRGTMATRKLIVFEHSSEYGSAPSDKLFDLVHIRRKEGVSCPRSFDDYEITIDEGPAGVKIDTRV